MPIIGDNYPPYLNKLVFKAIAEPETAVLSAMHDDSESCIGSALTEQTLPCNYVLTALNVVVHITYDTIHFYTHLFIINDNVIAYAIYTHL